MKLLIASVLFTLFPALAPQARPSASAGNEVLRWNRAVTDALAAAQTDPLTESRALAIVQVAVHDALNAVEARDASFLPSVPLTTSARGASADAAVAKAAHDALLALLPKAGPALDEDLARSLAAIAEGETKARGIEAGRAGAAAALASRAHDGSDAHVQREPGTKPGEYRPTPPDLTPAWMAQWGDVAPFALRSGAQFRPGPPPPVDGALAHRDVDQLRLIGGQDSKTRTDEQSQIARFWYENSGQGWNRIARTVAEARHLDAWESARLLALVNVAIADGYIASLEAKYHYNYWRPATAVRAAGAAEWLSYLGTPPVPDYPSAHAVVGAAAASVLARFFENDFVAFEMTSGAPYPGLTRTFWSFSEAARENGASRVLSGLHFPTAVRTGYQLGEDVGGWVFEHACLPRDAKSAKTAQAGPETASGAAAR